MTLNPKTQISQILQMCLFVQNRKKNENGNICVLCYNFWTNQNLDKVSTSKWPSELQFCERCTYIWQKMARNGRKTVIYKGTFVSNQSLEGWGLTKIRLYSLHWDCNSFPTRPSPAQILRSPIFYNLFLELKKKNIRLQFVHGFLLTFFFRQLQNHFCTLLTSLAPCFYLTKRSCVVPSFPSNMRQWHFFNIPNGSISVSSIPSHLSYQ